MIIMEEGSQKALMKHLQKEQERERRRIRDRQRRQSMSLEEREKHLARRRRNYQLRRQRAEIARLDPFINNKTATAAAATSVATKSIEYPSMVSISNANFHVQCSGLEIPAQKLDKFPRRLRLNHVKHLARSLDDHVDVPNNHRVAVDLIIKGNEIADSSCVPQKGLRLNRVKRLARSLKSDSEKVKGEVYQSIMEG